jgi:hypothetical protein
VDSARSRGTVVEAWLPLRVGEAPDAAIHGVEHAAHHGVAKAEGHAASDAAP